MKAVVGVLAASAVLWTATQATAERQNVTLQPECEIVVGLETVPVQAEPVTVPLRHSEALGDEISASFPEDSKVEVVSLTATDEENSLELVLNTAEAAPGEWPLVVTGTAGECRGTVTVATPETDGR
jgi:hypothetical protein